MLKGVARLLECHRLKDITRYKQLRTKGEAVSYGCLRLCKLKSGLSYPRLVVAVAKRYVRLAVKRNLIRRLVRECFRHRMGFRDGYDYLVMVIAAPENLSKEAVWKTLDGLLARGNDKKSDGENRCDAASGSS